MLGRRDGGETPSEQYRRLRLKTLDVERDEVLKIRSSGTIDHDVLEEVLASLRHRGVDADHRDRAGRRADRRGEDGRRRPRPRPAPASHLDRAPARDRPAGSAVCLDCVREGTRTVHLRICLSCGNVGCCDSSVGRHAERHFHTPAPGDAQLRAGRVVALVLPRRADRDSTARRRPGPDNARTTRIIG